MCVKTAPPLGKSCLNCLNRSSAPVAGLAALAVLLFLAALKPGYGKMTIMGIGVRTTSVRPMTWWA